MAIRQTAVQLRRWSGGTHPTLSNITREMRESGLRPYRWNTTPNQRYAVRSHGYTKILYVVDGSIEVILPDANQRLKLKAGDRVQIAARTRHGSVSGRNGATCLEAALR